MSYSIATDLDPKGTIRADADPEAEYKAYMANVIVGTVKDMGFTLEDFKRYIEGLRK
jgi:hypothetical protein